MTYNYYIMERNDIKKIDKLNQLKNKETFWDDVRKLTKRVTSDRSISRWQCLAEVRYSELITGCEDVRMEIEYGKPTRYFSFKTGEEVFAL
jgi:hypothetical protein